MRRGGEIFVEQVDAAGVAQRIHAPRSPAHRSGSHQDRRHRQPQWISGGDAEKNSLILHIHELLQYLNRRGAATFMTVAQHGLVNDMKGAVDVTYLADTVILLRYFEALGTVRRAMSIIETHRCRQIDDPRIPYRPGRTDHRQALDGFQGVLRGVPVYVGEGRPLLESRTREARALVGSRPSFSRRRAVTPRLRTLIREAGYHANVCDDLRLARA